MHDPLFKVDFKKIIPDTLHLFLRTSKVLVKNLQEWAVKAKRRQELSSFQGRCKQEVLGQERNVRVVRLERMRAGEANEEHQLEPPPCRPPPSRQHPFTVAFTPQAVHCSSCSSIIPKLPKSSRVSSPSQALLAETWSCVQRYHYHPLNSLPCVS